MKKIFSILIAIITAFCFCGCSNKNVSSTTDLATQYYNYAKDCIDSGDADKAEAALKEGIEKTDSQKLKELLDSIRRQEKEVSDNSNANDSSNSNTSSEDDSNKSENINSVKNTNDFCGLYHDKESYTDYTIYRKDSGYKILIKTDNLGGYFQLIDNGDGSYNVDNYGTNIHKAYGQYESTDLSYLLYAKSVNIKYSPETDEITVSTLTGDNSFYGEGTLLTKVIKRDNGFNVNDFTESFD